ncbi:hypothetical protein BGZ67_008574 [Mortierella alpina]|nr:hypothetical protein BGZ67_008574 [Mortierella alpina]
MAAVPDKKTFDKGAVVKTGSASLIALAAAVAKHDEKFQHAKATRSGIRAPRSVKKTSIWQRKNPGLAKRARKHDGLSPNEDPDGESARKAAMERKSKMYEMLKRGEDVPDRLREELLVEFEYKNRGHGSSDDDDSGSDDGRRIHNPANPFPVFLNQDAVDKQEWIQDATGEMRSIASQRKSGGGYSLANTTRHYNSTGERRAHGVGFYAFSQDEDERQRQMRELIEMRSQTDTKRSQHRSLRDKRREEIEARKRLIQTKRLKSLASTISMEPKG